MAMKNMLKKLVGGMAAIAIAVTTCGTSVFADDIKVNLDRARETFGTGATALTMYTSLTGEKRDVNNFNFTWFTDESEIIVECTPKDAYEGTPIVISMQTWDGDKVESTVSETILIEPTSFEDNTAVWTVDTIKATWPYDFSWIYALNFNDVEGCGITIEKVTFTNLDIPRDNILKLTGGIVLRDGVLVTEDNIDAPAVETTVEVVTEPIVEETTVASEEIKEEVTEATENTTENTTETSKADDKVEEKTEESSNNGILIIALIAVGVITIILIVVLVVKGIKKKNHGWH